LAARPDIAGILLAAGESRRMGFPKALLRIGGQTFVARLTFAMLEAVDPLIVVVGAHRERIVPAIPKDPRVRVVVNPEFSRGQLSSLKTALARLGETPAVMVHLIDHPTVLPSTFSSVSDCRRARSSPIVIARYQGHRGHPVVFDRSLFSELITTSDNLGARAVVNADPARVSYVDVDDSGVVLDLDTPSDVMRAGLEPVKPDGE
jgi:molybdenum cofactor cytidylyltransferase